jgi:hypothetical protein
MQYRKFFTVPQQCHSIFRFLAVLRGLYGSQTGFFFAVCHSELFFAELVPNKCCRMITATDLFVCYNTVMCQINFICLRTEIFYSVLCLEIFLSVVCCFGLFFGLLFCFVLFCFGLVWFGLVWFGLVWFV